MSEPQTLGDMLAGKTGTEQLVAGKFFSRPHAPRSQSSDGPGEPAPVGGNQSITWLVSDAFVTDTYPSEDNPGLVPSSPTITRETFL